MSPEIHKFDVLMLAHVFLILGQMDVELEFI